jgi:hypothetical protein
VNGDTNLASSVLSLFDGTADTVPVCQGPGQKVALLTASELRTLISAYSAAQVDAALSLRVPYTGASSAVNLGSQSLTCGAIEATGSLKLSSPATAGPGSATAVLAFGANTQIWGNGSFFAYRAGAQLLVGSDKAIGFSSGTLISHSGTVSAGDVLLTRGAANHLRQRNGIAPQTFDLTGTYTSDTAFQSLCLKATASAMQIGSARGTSESNLPVQLGHFNSAGVFTSGLSLGADNIVTIASIALTPTAGASRIRFNNFLGGSRAFIDSDNPNEIRLRNSSDTASSAALLCGAITCSGQITNVPPSSVTLSANGQFSIEMTSNTAGNLVYRGSDGTTRRSAITFV